MRAWIKDSNLITWNNASNLIQLWRNILMSTKFKKIVTLLAMALFVVPLLTACGSGQKTVDVKEDSFSITMPSSLKAGNITFHVSNIDSSANHEFIIIKTDLAPDKWECRFNRAGCDGYRSDQGSGSGCIPGFNRKFDSWKICCHMRSARPL